MGLFLKKKSYKNLTTQKALPKENTKHIGGGSCDMTCDCFANEQLINKE
ncbi:hypothetical protein [Pseudoalteromonas piscicida]|nr:hypothetical protein [Pseudoalteromonas piscicida]